LYIVILIISFTFSSDVELLADEVVAREPLVMERREQVHRLITSADLETGVSYHLI